MSNVAEGYRKLEETLRGSLRNFGAGTTVFEPGQKAKDIYVVNQGLVTVGTPDSQRRVTPDGGIFGEEAFYRDSYISRATTETDSILGVTTGPRLQILFDEYPEVAFALPGVLRGDRISEAEAATLSSSTNSC